MLTKNIFLFISMLLYYEYKDILIHTILSSMLFHNAALLQWHSSSLLCYCLLLWDSMGESLSAATRQLLTQILFSPVQSYSTLYNKRIFVFSTMQHIPAATDTCSHAYTPTPNRIIFLFSILLYYKKYYSVAMACTITCMYSHAVR